MNLRDFHYVLAVADSLSFKQAAKSCHVSQPTLSMQIKKLEDHLGLKIFERTNKQVMTTASGQRLIEMGRRLIEDEQSIYKMAEMLRDPEAGELRLGAIPTLASYIFPLYAPDIHKAFPKLHLLLLEEKTETLVEKLKNGKIDAALLALPIDEPTFASSKLFDDPFFLTVSADHPLAKKKSVKLSDLENNRLLLLDEGHCLRDQALAVCRAHGAREEESFRATSLETLRLMVQAPESGFMTLMPKIAALPNDRLRYIPFAGPVPSRSIGLVWRKSNVRSDMILHMVTGLLKKRKI